MATKYVNTHDIYKTEIRVVHRRPCVLEQAGGAEQHITKAAPNELKLGEGG